MTAMEKPAARCVVVMPDSRDAVAPNIRASNTRAATDRHLVYQNVRPAPIVTDGLLRLCGAHRRSQEFRLPRAARRSRSPARRHEYRRSTLDRVPEPSNVATTRRAKHAGRLDLEMERTAPVAEGESVGAQGIVRCRSRWLPRLRTYESRRIGSVLLGISPYDPTSSRRYLAPPSQRHVSKGRGFDCASRTKPARWSSF